MTYEIDATQTGLSFRSALERKMPIKPQLYSQSRVIPLGRFDSTAFVCPEMTNNLDSLRVSVEERRLRQDAQTGHGAT